MSRTAPLGSPRPIRSHRNTCSTNSTWLHSNPRLVHSLCGSGVSGDEARSPLSLPPLSFFSLFSLLSFLSFPFSFPLSFFLLRDGVFTSPALPERDLVGKLRLRFATSIGIMAFTTVSDGWRPVSKRNGSLGHTLMCVRRSSRMRSITIPAGEGTQISPPRPETSRYVSITERKFSMSSLSLAILARRLTRLRIYAQRLVSQAPLIFSVSDRYGSEYSSSFFPRGLGGREGCEDRAYSTATKK
mmetsp:Transcript_9823/g.27589  ORF Transcript_9823/g.27589 Transcript_9823/m.27589 type:complete len:243 (-) Transcript_9823:365-1093(-)